MRVAPFLFIMVGLTILFNLAGLTTTAGYILTQLDLVDSPQNITLSTMFLTIAAVLGGVATGGTLLIGFFSKTSPESYLLAGYAALLLYFVSDVTLIVSTANSYGQTWAYWIVVLICMPVAVGYVHAVVSWWGGKS